MVVCNAGYDDNDGNDSCEETEVGYYAEGDTRKSRAGCAKRGLGDNDNNDQSTLANDKAIPGNHAHWIGTGLTHASACNWECDTGYEENSDSSACAPSDPSTTKLTINGLTSLDGGRKAGTNNRNLTVKITGDNAFHYYLTHVAPAQGSDGFTPTGISGQGSTETGTSRVWVTRAHTPTSYTLPDGLGDGEHKLYLWVANVEETVSSTPIISSPFTLDTTAPVINLGTTKPANKDKGASASFSVLDTTDITTVSYSYCVGTSGCTQDSHFTEPLQAVITSPCQSPQAVWVAIASSLKPPMSLAIPPPSHIHGTG